MLKASYRSSCFGLIALSLATAIMLGCTTQPQDTTSLSAKPSAAEPTKPYARLKRPAIWVPDLDRAINFYQDVVGFTVEQVGELALAEQPILAELLGLPNVGTARRALFSSNAEQRVLFVISTPQAPEFAPAQQPPVALVIETKSLEALTQRANKAGFPVGRCVAQPVGANGRTYTECVVFGPGGHPVLMYELGAQEP